MLSGAVFSRSKNLKFTLGTRRWRSRSSTKEAPDLAVSGPSGCVLSVGSRLT